MNKPTQIRYRVWWDNKMTYPEANIKWLLDQDGVVCESDCDGYGAAFPEYYPDAIAMQSIGKRDQNDKEIYEGDIVRWEAEQATLLCVIECNDERCAYEMRRYEDGERCNYAIPLFKSYGSALEVLGNIHENPELLG